MPAARVSAPLRVTRMRSGCSRFTEPAMSSSPCPLAIGRDSPVRSDSSALDCPESTTPSAGTCSPGGTLISSPGFILLKEPKRSSGSSARAARRRAAASR